MVSSYSSVILSPKLESEVIRFKALAFLNCLYEHRSLKKGILSGLVKNLEQPMSIKDIIAKHQAYIILPMNFLPIIKA